MSEEHLSRRDLLAGTGALIVAIAAPRVVKAAQAGGPTAPNAFIRIDRTGQVTLVMPSVEMGQGIYTGEAMLLAEELEVDLAAVKLAAAPPDETKYKNVLLGQQATGGSTSIRAFWKPLRQAGADARLRLIAAAAMRWSVEPATCHVERGYVVHAATGRRAGYGDLVDAAARLPPIVDPPLKPLDKNALIGSRAKRLDTPDKVKGRAVYGIDAVLPDMRYAAVAACPMFGGSLASCDESAALSIWGVERVLRLPDAVAVVARNTWSARKGLAAVAPVWSSGPNAELDMARVWDQLEKTSNAGLPISARAEGDIEAAFNNAAKRYASVYRSPFLAHAAMEPINTLVHVRPDGCDILVGTQVPMRAQMIAAKLTGLPLDKIRIDNHVIGGGFGRRLEADSIGQAVALAMQVDHPLQVSWSREEDIQHDYYRPAYHDVIEAGVDRAGKPIAWRHKITGGSVLARWAPVALAPNGLDSDAVEGAAEPIYHFPSLDVGWVRCDPPQGVPISWWRGVGPAHNTFVVESFIDELAHAAHADAVEYRRALLAKNARALAVLDLAASKAGWNEPLPRGAGRGVSVHFAFGTYVACVLEAAVAKDGSIGLRRATLAVDCGVRVNPDSVAAQMEGGLLFGLSAALWGQITLKDGRVEQSNFNDYRVLRINEAPPIAVHQVESNAEPGGIGEAATVSAFPALGNAIFAATGVRLRQLPFASAALASKGRAKPSDMTLPIAAVVAAGLALSRRRPEDQR